MVKTYRVLIPLASPHLESDLITVGAAVAIQNKGEAIAIHILPPTHDTIGRMELDACIKDNNKAIAKTCHHTQGLLGITVTPVTIPAAKIQDAILLEAKARNASLILMDWDWNKPSAAAGAGMGNIIAKIVARAHSDVAILKSKGLKEEMRILLSTAGGPESNLGGEIAKALQNVLAAEITLLHLVKEKQEMKHGRAILEEFSGRHDLRTKRLIKTREDFTASIVEESKFHDLIIIGGSQEGLLKKMLMGTIPEKVVEQAPSSVLVTHRQGRLPFMTYLFGYRSR